MLLTKAKPQAGSIPSSTTGVVATAGKPPLAPKKQSFSGTAESVGSAVVDFNDSRLLEAEQFTCAFLKGDSGLSPKFKKYLHDIKKIVFDSHVASGLAEEKLLAEYESSVAKLCANSMANGLPITANNPMHIMLEELLKEIRATSVERSTLKARTQSITDLEALELVVARMDKLWDVAQKLEQLIKELYEVNQRIKAYPTDLDEDKRAKKTEELTKKESLLKEIEKTIQSVSKIEDEKIANVVRKGSTDKTTVFLEDRQSAVQSKVAAMESVLERVIALENSTKKIIESFSLAAQTKARWTKELSTIKTKAANVLVEARQKIKEVTHRTKSLSYVADAKENQINVEIVAIRQLVKEWAAPFLSPEAIRKSKSDIGKEIEQRLLNALIEIAPMLQQHKQHSIGKLIYPHQFLRFILPESAKRADLLALQMQFPNARMVCFGSDVIFNETHQHPDKQHKIRHVETRVGALMAPQKNELGTGADNEFPYGVSVLVVPAIDDKVSLDERKELIIKAIGELVRHISAGHEILLPLIPRDKKCPIETQYMLPATAAITTVWNENSIAQYNFIIEELAEVQKFCAEIHTGQVMEEKAHYNPVPKRYELQWALGQGYGAAEGWEQAQPHKSRFRNINEQNKMEVFDACGNPMKAAVPIAAGAPAKVKQQQTSLYKELVKHWNPKMSIKASPSASIDQKSQSGDASITGRSRANAYVSTTTSAVNKATPPANVATSVETRHTI
jgi:hypothetical protein